MFFIGIMLLFFCSFHIKKPINTDNAICFSARKLYKTIDPTKSKNAGIIKDPALSFCKYYSCLLVL